MGSMDKQPKSIQKAVRYIKQDASGEQLAVIKQLVDHAIERRIKILQSDKQEVGK